MQSAKLSIDPAFVVAPVNRRVALMSRHAAGQVLDLRLDAGFGEVTLGETALLWDEDLYAVNTMGDPERVTPRPHVSAVVDKTTLRAELPPASWSMFVAQLA